MNAHCQPLPPQVAEELLQVVTRAICDRPADSAPQRESRTRQMIHSVLGFEPRDGLEYMLATIAFGHFQLILDSMRDAFQGQSDVMKAKTKTTIVGLDRMMLQMIKELSLVRRRPMAYSGVGMVETARAAAMPEEAASPVGVASEAATLTPAPSAAVRPDETEAEDAHSDMEQPGATPPSFAAFARTMLALVGAEADEHLPAPATQAASVVVPIEAAPISASVPDTFADGIAGFLTPSVGEGDPGTFEDHIAAFETAYAATMEVLEEARALELAKTEAVSGD